MRTRTVVAAALLSLLITAQTDAQRPQPERLDEQIAELKRALPKLPELFSALAKPPEPSSDTAPLPQPSLTEPFEIGEALHDPGRIDDGVVSMLALMRVGVVPDVGSGAGAKEQRLALSESEVRALIDMGREDLQSADDIENLPYSFADLHRAVAGLVPGMSIEQMAQTFTRAYEMNPEDLIAKALMGRPIESETTLTRTQIWFLLMDGFAGAAAGGARWGTADRQLPDAVSPDPKWSPAEWREVLARLPLITASRLVTVTAPDVITQGKVKIAPVDVTVRMNASVPPLVSRLTGRTLIPARAGSLAGQEVTWRVRDESALEEIGTITSPTGNSVSVGADGLARFVFQPGVDSTGGAGETVDEWETVEASFQTRGLVASAYAVPAPLAGLTLGTSRARANLHLTWRSPDVLWVWVRNRYEGINFEIPGLGGGTRSGVDAVLAKLSKRRNGSYSGIGGGEVNTTQALSGPTSKLKVPCQLNSTEVSQDLRVLATPEVAGLDFGPTKRPDMFTWFVPRGRSLAAEPPDGGYYRLEFFPMTEPNRPESKCLPFIPADPERPGHERNDASKFIPFNDAQWTTSGQGYGIALKTRGVTAYSDFSSEDPLADVTGLSKEEARFLGNVKQLFQLTGSSVWTVVSGRTLKEIMDAF